MTLIAINRTKRGVHLVTDTKMTDVDFSRAFFVSKVLTFPHLPAAIVCKGHSLFAMMVLAEICDSDIVLRTFDDLLANAEELLGRAFDKLAIYVPEGHDQPRNGFALNRNTVVLAGWSQATGEPLVKVFQRTFEDNAFTITDVEYDWRFPAPPRSLEPMLVSMFQRKKPVPEILLISSKAARDQDEIHRATIGGHLVLTTIGADRIEQRVIHTWPDDLKPDSASGEH